MLMKTNDEAHFIDELIEVGFDRELLIKKSPDCPSYFLWKKEKFHINELLLAWNDLSRRGTSAKNMRPAHLERAGVKGSWGVGRFFFRVKTREGRIFDIYYDRAPKNSAEGAGQWFLFRELIE